MAIPPRDDPNLIALSQFYTREKEQPSKPRLLLHLVGSGAARHIEVFDEEKITGLAFALHRVMLFFQPTDWRIEEVQQFIKQRDIQVPPEISEVIENKVLHAKRPFLSKIWDSIFAPPKKNVSRAKLNDLLGKPELVEKPLVPPGVILTHIQKQEGDGNCLMRSFAVARGLKPENHPKFRKEAVNWLKNHWERDEELQAVIRVAINDNNQAEQKLYNENKPYLELVSQG